MSEISSIESAYKAPSQEFKIFTEHDRRLLEETSVPLLQKFLRDFPTRLPDALIFPDTGARPLPYLLEPVIQNFAEKRAVAVPRKYYFKILSSSLVKEVAHWEKRYGADITEVPGKILQLTNKSLHTSANHNMQDPEQQLALAQWYQSQAKDAEHAGLAIAPDIKIWHARAEEVKKDLTLHGIDSPTFAIFDDNASSAGGNIMGIRKGFNEKIPAYVLLGEEESSEEDRITVGKVVSNVRGSMDGSSIGFHYRQAELLGVTKKTGNPMYPYATISSDRDMASLHALRSDMRKMGEQLVSRLKL